MKTYLFVFLSFFSMILFAQEKFEKEYRIQVEEVPKKSLEFVNSLKLKKKIKWYAEESNEGKSFEAKTCHQKHLYSIEFNENGTLIDIEKKVSFSELNKSIQENLKNNLLKKFTKYKFKKIQIQYKGLESELKKTFSVLPRNKINTKVFYEVVIKAKKEKDYSLYEVLFNEKGIIINILKFKQVNSINLEF